MSGNISLVPMCRAHYSIRTDLVTSSPTPTAADVSRSLMRHAMMIVAMLVLLLISSWVVYANEAKTGWFVHLGSLLVGLFALALFCIQTSALAFQWHFMRNFAKRPGEFVLLGGAITLIGACSALAIPNETLEAEPALVFAAHLLAGWLALWPVFFAFNGLFTLRDTLGIPIHGEQAVWKPRFTIRNLIVFTTLVAGYCGIMRFVMTAGNEIDDEAVGDYRRLVIGPTLTFHVVCIVGVLAATMWRMFLIRDFYFALSGIILIYAITFCVLFAFPEESVCGWFLFITITLAWHFFTARAISMRGWYLTFRPWEREEPTA